MSVTGYTNISAIIQAIRAKLIADGLYRKETCFVSLIPTQVLQFPPGDAFAVLAPGRQSVEQGYVAGGGNDMFAFVGEVQIALWVRLALDPHPEDTAYLIDPVLGYVKQVNCCLSSLQMHFPHDAADNYVLCEPMRLIDVDAPVKSGQPNPSWAYTLTRWEVNYFQKIGC